MDKRYFVDDFPHCLGHVIEECGEVCQAAGKLLRWGPQSFNPEVPAEDRETNIGWLRREMEGLKEAIGNLECVIDEDGVPPAPAKPKSEDGG